MHSTSQSCLELEPHACACESAIKCATDKTEKNVRATKCFGKVKEERREVGEVGEKGRLGGLVGERGEAEGRRVEKGGRGGREGGGGGSDLCVQHPSMPTVHQILRAMSLRT